MEGYKTGSVQRGGLRRGIRVVSRGVVYRGV